eukprot:411049-Pelagomonas_calceolata.AAC.5
MVLLRQARKRPGGATDRQCRKHPSPAVENSFQIIQSTCLVVWCPVHVKPQWLLGHVSAYFFGIGPEDTGSLKTLSTPRCVCGGAGPEAAWPVSVDVPDQKGRLAILQVHARNKKLAEDVDLQEVALRTPGFAGADLANLLNEAAILTGRRSKAVEAEWGVFLVSCNLMLRCQGLYCLQHACIGHVKLLMVLHAGALVSWRPWSWSDHNLAGVKSSSL